MVWLHEINETIIKGLRNSLKYKDKDVVKSVTVRYSKPEGESTEGLAKELPLVTIKIYDIFLDLERIGTTQWLKQKVDETEDTVDLVSYPTPYWLFYEVTITAEYQEDIIDIITQLQMELPARGYILVPDSDTKEDVPLFIEMLPFILKDRVHGEKTIKEESLQRRFRAVLRYKLTAELPQRDIETFFKVKEVDLQVGKPEEFSEEEEEELIEEEGDSDGED